MTTTIELIKKADHLATETWVNGEGLGGEVSETFTKISNRLKELDKPDCVWLKLPCGRDSSGNDISSYEPSCITVYTDEPLPMKLTKFCHLCGAVVKEAL